MSKIYYDLPKDTNCTNISVEHGDDLYGIEVYISDSVSFYIAAARIDDEIYTLTQSKRLGANSSYEFEFDFEIDDFNAKVNVFIDINGTKIVSVTW